MGAALGSFFGERGGRGDSTLFLILETCVFVSKKRIFSGLQREGGEATVPIHVVLYVWLRALCSERGGGGDSTLFLILGTCVFVSKKNLLRAPERGGSEAGPINHGGVP